MIKCKLYWDELKEAVSGFNKIIPKRIYLPILNAVLFNVSDKEVVAEVSNLEDSLQYKFSGKSIDNNYGSFVLSIVDLKKLIKGKDSDPLFFEAEGSTVKVENHINKTILNHKFEYLESDDFPSTNWPDDPKVQSDNFFDCFREVSPVCSDDETKYILKGIFLDKKGHAMVATDGHRISVYNCTELSDLEDSIIICNSPFLSWTKFKKKIKNTKILFSDSDVRIGVSKINGLTLFSLRTGNWYYCSKEIQGTYPNYLQVIPEDTKQNTFSIHSNDIESVETLISSVTDKENSAIQITSIKEKLLMSIDNTDIELKESKSFGEWSIVIDGNYLLSALKNGFLKFNFIDNMPQIKSSKSGHIHVIMLMRK